MQEIFAFLQHYSDRHLIQGGNVTLTILCQTQGGLLYLEKAIHYEFPFILMADSWLTQRSRQFEI